MIYKARDFGIKANEDVTLSLRRALDQIRNIEGEKTLLFEKGEYYFNSDEAYARELFITNTVGDGEWKKGETPHLHRAAIWLEGIDGLTIDGGGSEFVMRGKMSNAVIIRCNDLSIKNLSISVEEPDMHGLEVISKGWTHVDFLLDGESRYRKWGRKFLFVGEGYETSFTRNRTRAWWTAKIPADDANSVWRTAHPLFASYRIKEIARNKFRAYYPSTSRFKTGDKFYVFDNRRDCLGIAIDRCKNISMENIKQHFAYGLALVCQDSENFSLKNSVFAPRKDGEKLIAAAADFLHFCSCRGNIEIKDNYFEGACDDCLNVHGIHFVVEEVDAEGISVKFSHPQAHGFNPLRVGDEIAFVDRASLLETSRAKILESRLEGEYVVKLKLDDASRARTGMAIENKSATANLDFSHNKMTRIITRGVLVTSGGKIRISDNDFDSTSMHSILISDDAKNWYESGPVTDVEIARNRFGRVRGYNVQVLPENSVHRGAVHKNIRIVDNVVESGDEGGFYFKSTDGVSIKNNKSSKEIKIVSVNSNIAKE